MSKIERLGIAQHYGIPTPLLDWSYNPLVALWYAVDGRKEETEEIVSQRQPAVLWLLDPGYANRNQYWYESRTNTDEPPFPDKPILIGNTKLDTWLNQRLNKFNKTREVEDFPTYTDFPLAIYSKGDFSARILRQSGAFTISSFNSPFHRLHDHLPPHDPTRDGGDVWSVAALTIAPSSFSRIRKELRGLNIHPGTVLGEKSFDETILRFFK